MIIFSSFQSVSPETAVTSLPAFIQTKPFVIGSAMGTDLLWLGFATSASAPHPFDLSHCCLCPVSATFPHFGNSPTNLLLHSWLLPGPVRSFSLSHTLSSVYLFQFQRVKTQPPTDLSHVFSISFFYGPVGNIHLSAQTRRAGSRWCSSSLYSSHSQTIPHPAPASYSLHNTLFSLPVATVPRK